MNLTNEQLCADQEHALLLKETGLMEGVEADGLFVAYEPEPPDFYQDYGFQNIDTPEYEYRDVRDIKTYRLDKILAKLPEWVWDKGLNLYEYLLSCGFSEIKTDQVRFEITELRFDLNSNYFTGQAAANAAAKLLHLLWKEKLI